MPNPLADLRGQRRIPVRLDGDLGGDLRRNAEVVVGADEYGAGLQILVAEWTGPSAPSFTLLRRLHEHRQGKRTFPLVTVVRRVEDRTGSGPAAAGTLRDSAGTASAGGTTADDQPSLLRDSGAESSLARTWLGTGSVANPTAQESASDVWMLGPEAGSKPRRLSGSQAARMLGAALEEKSATAARRRIVGLLEAAADGGGCPGLLSRGLFSAHYLLDTLPSEARWTEARERARPLLHRRGLELIEALGFGIQERTANALLLTSGQKEQRAVAVLLERNETFEAESDRLGRSPAAYGLAKARQANTPWLILMRGSQLRLYSAEPGRGVGSRSRVETWFELDLAALAEDQAAYLDLAFSARALARRGTVEDLLQASEQWATDLRSRLRQRIYERVVPDLAVGVGNALDQHAGRNGDKGLAYAYRLSMRVLFRLLFQAYAEDQGLLPYGQNEDYTSRSLKQRAIWLAKNPERMFDPHATTIWRDLQTVWRAIDGGDRGMDVPEYNGGLFDADPSYRPEGADLAEIELPDSVIGPALRDLLVDETDDGLLGPVDFRSLSVREFGTIYEGLLESELSRANVDLKLDKKTAYVPAKPNDEVVVRTGDVYFHNRSGERKATGSYFTPSFAVEHLLDHALEPVLGEHLQAVESLYDQGDEAGATEKFWDFRIADIAMGSGHFLIAALDRIEARMRDFLAERPLATVTLELQRLEHRARQAMGNPDLEIERLTLLRRQVARRCIYGVDVNETAVELARVAVWIHTFVPGLPISTLDHNLVCGDSLTGIGTVDEALDVLDPDRGERQMSIYSQPILEAMREGARALKEVGDALEADAAEVDRGRQQLEEAKRRAEPARLLFDAAVAVRLGMATLPGTRSVEEIAAIACGLDIRTRIEKLNPAHMPVLFPEVFVRRRPGFDVLIGNPPWEEATVEELGFWAVRFPGLKSLRQKEQQPEIKRLRAARPDLVSAHEDETARAEDQRRALMAGPYPGMGTGDPDLYKAFSWRYWDLVRENGAVGVVLPRSALSVKGSAQWRRTVLDAGAFADVTLLLNKSRWVFDMEPRYTVGLVSLRKGLGHRGVLRLRGPFSSSSQFETGVTAETTAIPVEEFSTWSDSAAIPSIPNDDALRVFRKIRFHPRLDLSSDRESASSATIHDPRSTIAGSGRPGSRTSEDASFSAVPDWRARPTAELHATNDKRLFRLDIPPRGEPGRTANSTRQTTSTTSQR